MTDLIAPAHARAAQQVATLLEVPLDRVIKRMIALQLCGPCPSCQGTGIYRWIGRTAEMCYTCRGCKMNLPRTWSDWTAAIAAATDMRQDGRLQRYLDARAARTTARDAVTRLRDRIRATGVDDAFDPDLARRDPRHAAVRDIARAMDHHFRTLQRAAEIVIAAKPAEIPVAVETFNAVEGIATTSVDELAATLERTPRPLAA